MKYILILLLTLGSLFAVPKTFSSTKVTFLEKGINNSYMQARFALHIVPDLILFKINKDLDRLTSMEKEVAAVRKAIDFANKDIEVYKREKVFYLGKIESYKKTLKRLRIKSEVAGPVGFILGAVLTAIITYGIVNVSVN